MRISGLIAALLLAAPAIAADPLSPIPENDRGPVLTVIASRAHPTSPDVFGTVALKAGVTGYDVRWRRVSAADEQDSRILAIASRAAGLDPVARLGAIHAEVRRRVAWSGDLDTYHMFDYWAQAGETLTRGAGDSEDIAVVTMQALKAAGVASNDIYLSVGRDSTRGADTLLIVRAAGQFYALDHRSDHPLASAQYARFVPIITLGKGISWLHGRRVAGRGALTNRRVIAAALPKGN